MGRPIRKAVQPKTLHLDAFSGASGNMFMGALLDLGLSRKALLAGLAPLKLDFKLVVKKVHRAGFAARYVDVRVPVSAKRKKAEAKAHAHDHAHSHDHPHAHSPSDAGAARGHSHGHGRQYSEIRDLIERAKLEDRVKERSLGIFEALAIAEAKVHGTTVEAVHFHEVGAVDAIVDVVAAAVGLAELGIERVTCSKVAVGHGAIESDHGLIPLPAPATLELLKGIPSVPAGVEWETLTPTGAAILKTVVDEFGAMPAMTVMQVGYGAGNDRAGRMPNVLRATLGQSDRPSGHLKLQSDRIVVLETNLDDLIPEHFDYLMERLFEGGALDVSLQNIQMKKNRPGFLVRVLASPLDREALARILFAESSAIGVRHSEWDRLILKRESRKLKTSIGTAAVKLIESPNGEVLYSPEYDDCKKIARKTGRPLREVAERLRDEARRKFEA